LLAESGFELDQYGRVHRASSRGESLYAIVEGTPIALSEFARESLDWLPFGKDRLLYTSSWRDDNLPDHSILFETIRRGSGISADLDQMPGVLFNSTKGPATHYEERPINDVAEEAIAMWLLALMLEWTWTGFAVVSGCQDVIHIGDGYLMFNSVEKSRLTDAEELVTRYGLKSQAEFPWR
jgi:hypothetical protein